MICYDARHIRCHPLPVSLKYKRRYELERLQSTHHLQLPHDAGAVSDEGGDPLAHLLQLILAEVTRSTPATAQLRERATIRTRKATRWTRADASNFEMIALMPKVFFFCKLADICVKI